MKSFLLLLFLVAMLFGLMEGNPVSQKSEKSANLRVRRHGEGVWNRFSNMWNAIDLGALTQKAKTTVKDLYSRYVPEGAKAFVHNGMKRIGLAKTTVNEEVTAPPK